MAKMSSTKQPQKGNNKKRHFINYSLPEISIPTDSTECHNK